MQPVRVDITITTDGVVATASRTIGPCGWRGSAVHHAPGAAAETIAGAVELADELAADAEVVAAAWARSRERP